MEYNLPWENTFYLLSDADDKTIKKEIADWTITVEQWFHKARDIITWGWPIIFAHLVRWLAIRSSNLKNKSNETKEEI